MAPAHHRNGLALSYSSGILPVSHVPLMRSSRGVVCIFLSFFYPAFAFFNQRTATAVALQIATIGARTPKRIETCSCSTNHTLIFCHSSITSSFSLSSSLMALMHARTSVPRIKPMRRFCTISIILLISCLVTHATRHVYYTTLLYI